MQLFYIKGQRDVFVRMLVSTSSEYWRQVNNIPWMMVKKNM